MAVDDTRGLVNLSNVEYKKIAPSGRLFVDSGIDGVDNEINGFEGGRVTLITGRPGEGKSTFVHRIALYAVSNGIGTLLVDGEHETKGLMNDLHIKLVGHDTTLYDTIKYHRKYIKQPKPLVYGRLQKWSNNKLWVYSKSSGQIKTLDKLFKLYSEMIRVHNIKFIILDNLMTLLDHAGSDQNKAQADFMNKCHDLAVNTGIHIILVTHPNKTAQKGETIDYYQISGASELVNLADNVIQIVRVEDEEYDGYAELLKNRGYGIYKKVKLDYDIGTGSLIEHNLTPTAIRWQEQGNQEQWTETDLPFGEGEQ